MSPSLPWAGRASLCFPRVSGDEPDTYKSLGLAIVFSPRERG